MDTPNIQAAGARPIKQTFDQAPQTRQVIQNKSDIFGFNTPAPAPQVSRQSARPKTDIFSNDCQAPKQQDVLDLLYEYNNCTNKFSKGIQIQ